MPIIPPLLVSNEVMTEFEAKANIFNKYFVSQCTTIKNNSVLPGTLNHLTDDKISSFNISSEAFFQLIKNLDPNKAYGQDRIYVKMLKLCTPSICQLLTYSSRTVLLLENLKMFGKKAILFQSREKGINNKKLPTSDFIANLQKINGKTYIQLNFQFY